MLHYPKDHRGLPANPAAGFSFIELMISFGILSVILAVVVSKQSTYTDSVALSNLVDDISLTFSQVQTYGIGVREFTPGSSDFTASYGLTFSILDSGSSIAYLSFADRNDNQRYDGDWSCPLGGASECVRKVDISRGNYIESICVVRTSGNDQCDTARRVDISFARPKTEAQLIFFDSSGQVFSPNNMQGARINLKSPGGTTRSVTVYNTGQVSVDTTQSGGGQSCVGTYNCSQWDNTSRSTCEDNGHNCNWSSSRRRCNGGNEQCSDLSQPQCTPVGCSWQ